MQHTTKTGPTVPRHENGQTAKAKSQLSDKENLKMLKEFVVRVLRSIYGLKQSGRIWYKKFKAEMVAQDFVNEDIAPCLFIKHQGPEFVIVALYVDDINLFGTPALISETIKNLKGIFEMKDLGEPSFCLGLQFDYLPQGILINQATYTKRIIKQFNMHNAHLVSTPMELRFLDPDKATFKNGE
jgi:hypothetical protein